MSCMRCSTPDTCRHRGCQGSSVNADTKPYMNSGKPLPVKSASRKKTKKIRKA